MQPTSPVLTEELKHHEITFAKDQPEYTPLPAIRNSRGMVLTRWKPTNQERAAIAAGADVLLTVWTFNQPLQPILMEVAECDRDLVEIARFMEVV